MITRLQKAYSNLVLKPFLQWYLKKERSSTARGFQLVIKPTVFHPNYFFSSGYLFDFVSRLNLNGKSFLEIGSGSGLISLLAHQKKARVSCADLNPVAIDCTTINFKRNFGNVPETVHIYESDVFSSIPESHFDVIVINPPYFFSAVSTAAQLAWNCGANGEYFVKLFSGLKNYSSGTSYIYMILADNCDLERINRIAKEYHFKLELIEQQKVKWEMNYIFRITQFIGK
jgi:release factor glutamine methyltransferase